MASSSSRSRMISSGGFEDSPIRITRPGESTVNSSRNGHITTIRSVSSSTSRSRTLVEPMDHNSIVALVEGKGLARGEVGMAYYNLQTSDLILCQFPDTISYRRLVTKLNIFKPHEVLMPSTVCEKSGTASQMYLQLQSETSNISIVPLPRKNFNEGRGYTYIKKLVNDKYAPVVQQVTQKYYALAATAALIQFTEVSYSLIFSPKTLKIEFQGSENTCMIDSMTAQHLELLRNNYEPVSPESLLGLLSACKTPGGTRLLRMNILQPPCKVDVIESRLNCVNELLDNREAFFGLRDVLGRLPVDIDHVISSLIQIPKKETRNLLENRINNLLALKHTLAILPLFVTTLENLENNYFRDVCQSFGSDAFKEMSEKILEVVNEEAKFQKGAMNMKRQRCFAVSAEKHPVLDIARKAYLNLLDDIHNYVVELSSKMNLPFRLIQNNRRGFYIQYTLPGGSEQAIPNFPSYFLNVRKSKKFVTFTTEVVLNMDLRCKEVEKEIENITHWLISDLIKNLRHDIAGLYVISEGIAKLDVIYALTNYALTTKGCVRPKFSELVTAINSGRHPVLDSVAKENNTPNNTFLSAMSNFILITGPNMSGKTTYLKQVATLQILAQLGTYVPAESAVFRTATNIFSRIGTGDNIEDGASSFAVEMREMNYILTNVDDSSIVLIDELGRGTSIAEATSMSWALAEALLKTKSFILFATHYLFLTKLEGLYLNVTNYTMETQEWHKVNSNRESEENKLLEARLRYTHVIKRGVTDIEHYGLKLAANSTLPPEVIKRACSYADKIKRDRQHIPNTTITEPQVKKVKYLLASQLYLVSTLADKMSDEDLNNYLFSVQQDMRVAYPSLYSSSSRNGARSSVSSE